MLCLSWHRFSMRYCYRGELSLKLHWKTISEYWGEKLARNDNNIRFELNTKWHVNTLNKNRISMKFKYKVSTRCWFQLYVIFFHVMNVFIKPLQHVQGVTWGQFLNVGEKQILIQSFPSLRLVALPRPKSPIFPTIYLERENKWIHVQSEMQTALSRVWT